MSHRYNNLSTEQGIIDSVVDAYNVFWSLLTHANKNGIQAVEKYLFPDEYSSIEVKPKSISKTAKLYAEREEAEIENWPQNARILEIGVCSGVHLLSMAKNLKPRLLHGVDIDLSQLNKKYTDEMSRIASSNIEIKVFEGNSIQHLSNLVEQKAEYDVVYIDAMHRYQYVAKEIELSLKILSKKGKLVLNDYCLWFVPSMEPSGD